MAPRTRKQERAAAGLKWGEGFIEEIPREDGSIRYKARWYEDRGDGTFKLAAKSFADRDSAENHLRTVYRDKRDGRYMTAGDMTVADAIHDYLERGRGRWKANTYATYRQRATTHIIPRIGAIKLSELTTATVQQWIDRLMRNGPGPKTIEDTARVLNGAMREAMRLGLITVNPVTNTRTPVAQPAERAVWSPADINRVLAAATHPKYHALYYVALYTGIRPGELRALQWSDIDFDAKKLTVRRTMTRDEHNRDVVGTSTKTKRSRSIAIPERVATALRQWRVAQNTERLAAGSWDDRGFVFTGDGGTPLGSTTWQHRHTEIIRRAGVRTITLHGMRHSFATAMMAQGVHPLIVSRILGHAKIQTTLDIYSHPDDSLQRSAMDAFGDALEEANTGEM